MPLDPQAIRRAQANADATAMMITTGRIISAAELTALSAATDRDPRDPDPTKTGIFRDHNCWKCQDGAKPCVRGGTHRCEYPHARND